MFLAREMVKIIGGLTYLVMRQNYVFLIAPGAGVNPDVRAALFPAIAEEPSFTVAAQCGISPLFPYTLPGSEVRYLQAQIAFTLHIVLTLNTICYIWLCQ